MEAEVQQEVVVEAAEIQALEKIVTSQIQVVEVLVQLETVEGILII